MRLSNWPWGDLQPHSYDFIQKVYAACSDVLAEVGRTNSEAFSSKLSKSSACMTWTCRRSGWVGSVRTRERCFTVTARCASPSMPNPARMRISFASSFEKR